VTSPLDALPSDLAAAHAMILGERAARLSAEAEARAASASVEAMIAHLRLEIEKLRRALYGVRSERKARLLEQMELQLQPPAPFHATPRGLAGPNLLAMILFEKFGQRQPLNRQSVRYAREGVELSVSTLADQFGACTAALLMR
jgi:hypothetical protein